VDLYLVYRRDTHPPFIVKPLRVACPWMSSAGSICPRACVARPTTNPAAILHIDR